MSDPDQEADDAIEIWHQGGGFGMGLLAWLGWSKAEWGRWCHVGYATPIKPDAPCYAHVHKGAS